MSDSILPPAPPESTSPGRYVVIARRYRPQSFDELVGQEHVARALQQAITSDRVGHAYLFTGARGVGKTSAARILAKALNCVHGPSPTPCNECDVCRRVATGDDVDVLEIDGASNRGIDEIRQLRQNVAVRPSRVRFKVYIIDEVHMLTKEAFNALLKTLEEPPEHVKFIFATTEANKIPITILSRCQRFDFAGISTMAIQDRLSQIAASEGVDVEREALQILASRAAGSMRDSQSLLEQLLALGHAKITTADVNELLGIAPAERLCVLVRQLAASDATAALAELDATLESGVEVGLLLDQLMGYFRDVMAVAVGCTADQMLYALPSQSAEVAEIGKKLSLSKILAIVQILDHTAARMRVSIHGRTLVEMAVVRICRVDELDDLAAVVAELRGTAGDGPSASSQSGSEATKKNGKSTGSLASALAERTSSVNLAPTPPAASTNIDAGVRRADPPHAVNTSTTESATPAADSAATGSVLAEWQRAVADRNSNPSRPPASARPSRREQLAAIAEQPFVRKAMELFDVSPEKLRYTPPEERRDG